MRSIFATGLSWLLFFAIGEAAAQASTERVPSDSTIRRILAQRIDQQRQSVGIVVGVIEPAGRRIVAYGIADKRDPRPVDGSTIFQLGSITKIFTALLLADMTQRGEVALSDPVSKFLPAEVRIPERHGQSITLLDLVTQTSGLPRLPPNFAPEEPSNPYADYSAEKLYQFLGSFELTRDIGSQYEYSNLGFGLLGHALTQRSGLAYEALVRSRICEPLGMGDTRITLTPEMEARLAAGHDFQLNIVPTWDFQVLAGAGAFFSSANDLLNFLAANLHYTDSVLAPSMVAMRKAQRPTVSPDLNIGLAWRILTRYGSQIVWHDGGTYGYSAFLGFDPHARIGVVVLSNTFTVTGDNIGIDDIGFHLLNSEFPLAERLIPKELRSGAIDPHVLEGYVGQYELAPNILLAITREKTHLYAQVTNQEKFEVFPESESSFFYRVIDAQITFGFDNQKRATHLDLHQFGHTITAERIK